MAIVVYEGNEKKNNVLGAYTLMYGDDGDDTLQSNYAVADGETIIIFGGNGDDVINYIDGYNHVGYLFGENGHDDIEGGDRGDRLYGGGGDDLISGSDGSDVAYGGRGDDRLFGYWDEAAFGDDEYNYLHGGDGDDVINAQLGGADMHGGRGRDILIGAKTVLKDEFRFDTKLSNANADIVRNFQPGVDKFSLDDDIFKNVARSAPESVVLAPGELRFGSKAKDGDDHLIYWQGEGKLYYDPDATGPKTKILFATLAGKPDISSGDFWIVT